MMKKHELLNNLSQFTGSENSYYHPMFEAYRYTDGIRFLAQNAGCYWLLEHILIHQSLPEIMKEEFQVWKITVEDSKATITVDDGNDNIVKKWTDIFTDFPLDEISLWFENQTLFLPSER